MTTTHLRLRLTTVVALVGLAYGYISALHNRNPYYPVPGEKYASEYQTRAFSWQPSPLWIPSYLLCKVPRGEPGIGISWSKSGYLFRSYAGLYVYELASAVLGAGMGMLAGWAAAKMKPYILRRRS